MTYGALTNEVGYITDIPWLLGIYRSKTMPSPSGCALGFGVVFDNKSLQPWYNYCIPLLTNIHTTLDREGGKNAEEEGRMAKKKGRKQGKSCEEGMLCSPDLKLQAEISQ